MKIKIRDIPPSTPKHSYPRWRNKKDFCLFIISTVYLLVCMYVVSISNGLTDARNMNLRTSRKQNTTHYTYFPDLLIDGDLRIPDPDICHKLLIPAAVFALILLLCSSFRCFTITRRSFYVIGTMYLLRALCINLTVIPNPNPLCVVEGRSENPFYDGFLILTGQRTACGDIFFSGHTIVFATVFWLYVTYQSSVILTVCIGLYCFVGMFTLVFSRLHYSIDVLTGFILTSLIWSIFHWGWMRPGLENMFWVKILRHLDDVRYVRCSNSSYYNDRVNEKIKMPIK
jgi:hypothetical protein